MNVSEHVKTHGGSIQYGWAIWDWPEVMLEAEHHAVWRSDTGELVDITPGLYQDARILFLPDPLKRYDFRTKKRIRNVWRSSGNYTMTKRLIKANKKLFEFEEKYSEGDVIVGSPHQYARLKQAQLDAMFELIAEISRRR